jgi:hypothetical protein
MIRLDTVNRSLTLFLGGAQVTAPLQIVVSYSDQTSATYLGSTQLTNSNGTTAVTICSAPIASVIRDIDMVTVLNTDSATQTVTIQLLDTATTYKIIAVALLVGDKLTYTHGSAWQVVSSSGNIKYTVLATTGVDSFSGGSTGLTPATATTGIVTLGGTLAVASGGTGTATPALVAGTNVTITGSWPNQTINSSNSGGTVTSVAALTLGTTGTDVSSTVANSTTTPVITLNLPTASATNRGALSAADWTTFNSKGSGTVTSVTGTAPVVSSGGTTPAISMAAATASVNGYLTSTDWTTFNSKGSGSVTSVAATVPAFLSVTGSPITTSGTLAISYSGTALPIANGGSGQTTAQAAMNSFAGAVTSGSYLRGNGTNVVMATIQAADVPTLNQNTTGTASNVTGTVAIANGGTGLTTTPANGALDIGNGTGFTRSTLTAGTGITVTNASGSITIAAVNLGTVTSVTGTSPVVSSGGATPAISLAASYGDTQNPYASKTANYVLAAPNGTAGVPTFRAIVAADIPTLNQNTTGNAATATSATTATNIAGGANLQIPYNTGSGATSFIVAPTIGSTYLQYNGTGFAWASAAGLGTVTSVAATVPAFLSITGSPITTAGTLAISYSGTALPIANGGTGQTTAGAAFNALSPITTTGDLIIGNGTNSATRLGIGANTYVLTSNGTTATWAAASGGTPTSIANGTSNVSISSSNGAITASTNGTSALTVTTGQILQFNSGYGSVATAYGCRAWVNFNGQSSAAIRGSANISSITINGTGDWTLNFTTAMPDANYAAVFGSDAIGNNDARGALVEKSYDGTSYHLAGSLGIIYGYTFTSGTTNDGSFMSNVAIFR